MNFLFSFIVALLVFLVLAMLTGISGIAVIGAGVAFFSLWNEKNQN